MSRRSCRALLWVALAGTVPLPMLIVGPGRVPAARLLQLGSASGTVMLLERSGGVVGLLTAVFLLQAAVYLLALWLAADLAARGLARLPPRAAGLVTLGLVAALLVVAVSQDLYHTPFAADQAHTDLLGVYR